MANVLNVALCESIRSLFAQGWSRRRIARELGVDRETVGKYVSAAVVRGKTSQPADRLRGVKTSHFAGPPGSRQTCRSADRRRWRNLTRQNQPATCRPAPAPAEQARGTGQQVRAVSRADPGQGAGGALGPADSSGPGRRRQRLRLRQRAAVRAASGPRRAAAVPPDGMRAGRRSPSRLRHGRAGHHAGRQAAEDARLSHRARATAARRTAKPTFTQTTEDFLRCLENAFAHFGGVPKTLVIDNLKAAVLHPDWFDPELTPKVQSFCQHYGTVILPTKPYMPRHKGKVEAGVEYVQEQRTEGAQFASLEEQNQHLAALGTNGRRHADSRHDQAASAARSSTKSSGRRCCRCRASGSPSSTKRSGRSTATATSKWPRRTTPCRPSIWAARSGSRWDARLVRIFNRRWEQIAAARAARAGPLQHARRSIWPQEKISGLERGADYLLEQGAAASARRPQQWAEAMLTARGIEGTRVLQGLLA